MAAGRTGRVGGVSGGSFNYLCHAFDLEDIRSKQGDLQHMIDFLAGLGYADDAARESAELLMLMRQWDIRAQVIIKRLSEVWKSAEWWQSCDSSEESFKATLIEYRGDTATEEKA